MNPRHFDAQLSLALFDEKPHSELLQLLSIASVPQIESLLNQDAAVAVGVSGGKDSQAAALVTFEYLDALGHRGPRCLIHSDLGMVEWDDSLIVCQRLADYLKTELVIVRRNAGGMMERWEARWAANKQRYAELKTVTLVLPWSTPSMRFCTSELKTQVIFAELRRRFKGLPIINVTGVRREESAGRAKGTVANYNERAGIWNWRPLSNWLKPQVLARIAKSGLLLHNAYTHFNLSRVSCMYCIMSSRCDMKAAANAPQTHQLYRRIVDLEIDSTFGFQGSRWLADVAPALLATDKRKAVVLAQHKARVRVAAEAAIEKDMLFFKGWPDRVLTHREAAILAEVRRTVAALMGIEAQYLTVPEIRQRYEQLLDEKKRRDARRDAKQRKPVNSPS